MVEVRVAHEAEAAQSVGMVGSTVLSVMYSIGWPSAPPPPLQVATLPFTLITGTAAMSASASLRWGFMYSTGLPPLVPRARTAAWVRARRRELRGLAAARAAPDAGPAAHGLRQRRHFRFLRAPRFA